MESEQRGAMVAEPSVDEGAFWHTNMDLYYGYSPGEVVEVEHEPTKYWLARIEFSYKHLVLLKWLGNYGEEFWIDTSLASSATTGSSNIASSTSLVNSDDSFLKDYPRRLFSLGHHLQSQIKSQFKLEKPTKILVKPSLYNPAKDPYANVKTIEDLLAHEVNSIVSDAFSHHSASAKINEPTTLALVANKTKINYGQEDQVELEAALQNLTDEIDGNQDDSGSQGLTPPLNSDKDTMDPSTTKTDSIHNEDSTQNKDSGFESDASNNNQSDRLRNMSTGDSLIKVNNTSTTQGNSLNGQTDEFDVSNGLDKQKHTNEEQQERNNDETHIGMCKKLQESAISKGRYLGIELSSNDHCKDEIYFLKPKQFFDIGGANQERVFVPGTLVEICHSSETTEGLSLFHWFAFVVKNLGGRLTLRWFICDEAKFKQGRLDLKSFRSKYIQSESDASPDSSHTSLLDDKIYEHQLPIKAITFSLHFCDPKVHTISYARQNGRSYRLPDSVTKHLDKIHASNQSESKNTQIREQVEDAQLNYIFEPRRMNLDKDRPLIDHILSTVRNKAPNYLDLVFAPKDVHSKREILISCPKMTKLVRGYVKRELEPGIFEVGSDLLPGGEVIRFVHPFDSSYSILPVSWAEHNQDCLSIDPSRNVSPSLSDNKDDFRSNDTDANDGQNMDIDSQQKYRIDLVGTSSCLITSRTKFPRAGACFHKLPNLDKINFPELKSKISNLSDYDPKCWSTILRSQELQANSFHCCIDNGMKSSIESKFKVMDQLEVVHPSSDSTICSGRIRKVVYPLLWIQLSADSFTLLPFNSTNIYPAKWCETYQHPLVSFLPPRKRHIDSSSFGPSHQNEKKKKKLRINDEVAITSDGPLDYDQIYVKESFDLKALEDRQSGIDYILNEKSMYIKIYFNHKCFTGPSLSKSKICTLPQYVGPGPMRLVMEEVVTKVISVAYVPPRILNDLSSKSFKDLLILRNLKNTTPLEFKAKYQKRVHREDIPICLNPDDVAMYCECLCEHLKCCYNLFGPNQYDGDDCPGHCRALTKSNKFMKRATYYRDKARAGEFLGSNNGSSSGDGSKKANGNGKTASATRPRYAGRGSSESTSSSVSRSDRVTSRASSSSGDDTPANEDPRCNTLNTVQEEEELGDQARLIKIRTDNDENICSSSQQSKLLSSMRSSAVDSIEQRVVLKSNEQQQGVHADCSSSKSRTEPEASPQRDEFDGISGDNNEFIANDPNEWSVDDVCRALEALGLGIFVRKMRSESIDGRALLLLDEATIEEHFQKQSHANSASDELEKLCRFVEFAKVRLAN